MPTLQWLDDGQARRAVEKVPYRMLRPDDTLSCWKGGGGFRFYRLGETVFDVYGA